MKDVAILALVVLPFGMTIIEILAAGESSAPGMQATDGETRVNSDREATAAPALDESRTGARWPRPPHASGAPDGHTVPGKTA
jgi:hypothetical protein